MRRVEAWTLALAAALGLLGAGCAETHNVTVPVSEADLAKLRSQLSGKTAAIGYWQAEGTKPGAIAFRSKVIRGTVYVDPFVLRLVDDSKEQSIPHTHLTMIDRVDHRRGVAQGGGIGALVGILLGGATGYLAGKDCSSSALFCIDRTDAAATFAVTGGAIGVLTGVLVGRSSRSTWVFAPTAQRQ